MPALTLMVQGTSSGAGKSILATALCRIYARRGLRVLPFKAQNMSNNAAVTPCGGEIGRAQALQARAAGVPSRPEMNPVLVKPLADTRSEVVVLGRRDPALTALPWLARKATLWEVARGALASLREDADLVIIEGAGSPAEINLPDIVNMRVAREASAPVLLVTDIDRGGAFASLYGTWALLPEEDRARIGGFVLNRFRGDPTLLAPAPQRLRALTGIATLGIVPYIELQLPEEDAASLTDRGGGPLAIAAVRLPHLSNFDDLDPLAGEPGVHVRWVDDPAHLAGASAVVLPGTRNTTADLRWLWERGLAAAIRARASDGGAVVGLCGGFQMLGERVADPLGLEGGGEVPGLGLLPLRTTLGEEKTTRSVVARWTGGGPLRVPRGLPLSGYEIHHGVTAIGAGAVPLMEIGGTVVGAGRGPVWGGYLHGLFESDALRTAWLAALGAEGPPTASWESRLDVEIDRLADTVERALEMRVVDRLVGVCAAGGTAWAP